MFLALRVLLEKESDCYLAVGLIHQKFKPMPNRFKDYIAMPKENMYQSLHTTVFGVDGRIFEIQFRTYEMEKLLKKVLHHTGLIKKRELKKLKV